VRPDLHLIEGPMPLKTGALLRRWIELNRATLISSWDGDIDTRERGRGVAQAASAHRYRPTTACPPSVPLNLDYFAGSVALAQKHEHLVEIKGEFPLRYIVFERV
jgi:hypothetical protein